jgi:hypothetical protein
MQDITLIQDIDVRVIKEIKMRIVGNRKFIISNEGMFAAGVKASNLMSSLDIPQFRTKGVFRGTHELLNQMDAERRVLKQRWLNEHSH